jgi:DNA-binding MarR family transcriptional regulator
MPAHKPTRSQSDNSDSRPVAGDRVTARRDPRTRRIVDYLHDHNGATTSQDIATEAGWTREETETHLQRLEDATLIQLLGDKHDRIVLLTSRGEELARREL